MPVGKSFVSIRSPRASSQYQKCGFRLIAPQFVIATKGAPEAIADLCHFSEQDAALLNETVAGMAAEGLRVLGVAKAQFSSEALPDQQHDFEFEFLGLVALADPVRPAVPSAIQECQTAGIRVIMITGDYPGTAMSIARQIGLEQRRWGHHRSGGRGDG